MAIQFFSQQSGQTGKHIASKAFEVNSLNFAPQQGPSSSQNFSQIFQQQQNPFIGPQQLASYSSPQAYSSDAKFQSYPQGNQSPEPLNSGSRLEQLRNDMEVSYRASQEKVRENAQQREAQASAQKEASSAQDQSQAAQESSRKAANEQQGQNHEAQPSEETPSKAEQNKTAKPKSDEQDKAKLSQKTQTGKDAEENGKLPEAQAGKNSASAAKNQDKSKVALASQGKAQNADAAKTNTSEQQLKETVEAGAENSEGKPKTEASKQLEGEATALEAEGKDKKSNTSKESSQTHAEQNAQHLQASAKQLAQPEQGQQNHAAKASAEDGMALNPEQGGSKQASMLSLEGHQHSKADAEPQIIVNDQRNAEARLASLQREAGHDGQSGKGGKQHGQHEQHGARGEKVQNKSIEFNNSPKASEGAKSSSNREFHLLAQRSSDSNNSFGQSSLRQLANHSMQRLQQSPLAQNIRQIQFHMHDQNRGEIRLRLNPENLGQVRIHISINGNQLTGQIMADNAEAARILQEHLHRLESSFREGGFESSGLNVSVGGQGQGASGSEQSREDRRHTASRANNSEGISSESSAPAASLVQESTNQINYTA